MLSIAKKRVIILTYDTLAALGAVTFSVILHRNTVGLLLSYEKQLLIAMLTITLLQLFCNYIFGVYRGYWHFISVKDAFKILKSSLTTTALALVIHAMGYFAMISAKVFVIYALILVATMISGRVFYRNYFSYRKGKNSLVSRVLIVGAGDAGELVVREMLTHQKDKVLPVLLVDDDDKLQNRELHGIRVKGKCNDIPGLVNTYKIDLIVIAIPSIESAKVSEIFMYTQEANIPCRILPSVREMVSGGVRTAALREVSINDLLCREPVKLNQQGVEELLKNKIVAITGGGGSIGSELCMQIAAYNPKKILIIEHAEFNLFKICQDINIEFPEIHIMPMLVSIADTTEMEKIFSEEKIEIIFHAAAYKHVPLLENQVCRAVKNNVIGTKIIAELASRNNVGQFVMISTDKAVNPCNTMGTTKCIAEKICQYYAANSSTQFITVRFGNVLGSVGSVIPLFEEQIRKNGPVTVTHPDATRYFMTIPEAAQLILQAGTQGQGSEIFVLDMGEPISIKFLAEQMIRLMGMSLSDIAIKYTGLREGERLHETLFYNHEELKKTNNDKIFIAVANGMVNTQEFMVDLLRLQDASINNEVELSRRLLKEISENTSITYEVV
ncbi:MAG: nucleoside-diphosphate sugar epimerase/dehydratase [Coxiellaceae bacterium]|nr:nucleoside-diphosphate sugar epimerase/dehydratase [Coxiellaceae bacterium]